MHIVYGEEKKNVTEYPDTIGIEIVCGTVGLGVSCKVLELKV